ncbi:MAG: Smr/MutS family protein [Chitinophagales bacterium]
MKKNKDYIRVGDMVQLIFTDEVGLVVDFFDGETLMVEIDGQEIPVFMEHLKKVEEKEATPSNIAPIHLPQHLKKNPKKPLKKQDLQKKKEDAAQKINSIAQHNEMDYEPDRGIHIALQPFYDDSGDINYFLIHLINDSGYALQFDYQLLSIEYIEFELKKKISGRETMILNSMDYDLLNEQPQLQFKFSLLKKDTTKLLTNFEKTIKPKAKMLRRVPEMLKSIAGKAYIYTLFHQVPPTPTATPPPKPESRYIEKLKLHTFENEVKEQNFSEKIYINAEERVIDLHIEKLAKSYRHLTKTNIMLLQLNECQKNIEEAIKRKEKNMVVIHGIGKGKLKSEVFRLLMNYPEVKNFKNEYNHRYGFGATEIFFEYEE